MSGAIKEGYDVNEQGSDNLRKENIFIKATFETCIQINKLQSYRRNFIRCEKNGKSGFVLVELLEINNVRQHNSV